MTVTGSEKCEEGHLIERLRQRDQDAFVTLFECYSDKMFRLPIGLLNDEAEAESIVQEAFLRLFQNLERFEERSRLGTWLYRVTYNLCMDQLRRRYPSIPLNLESNEEEVAPPTVLVDWGQWPESLLTKAELTALLDEAISALPEKYRAIFILREIEGLSTQETAQVAGISESTAKVRLHRARLSLRELLSESVLERT